MEQAKKNALLSESMKEAHVVRSYLNWIEENGRGRTESQETIQRRIDKIDAKIASLDKSGILERLRLLQRRQELETKLRQIPALDLTSMFVAIGKRYADRMGISYSVWRTVGVPAKVLTAAGIKGK